MFKNSIETFLKDTYRCQKEDQNIGVFVVSKILNEKSQFFQIVSFIPNEMTIISKPVDVYDEFVGHLTKITDPILLNDVQHQIFSIIDKFNV